MLTWRKGTGNGERCHESGTDVVMLAWRGFNHRSGRKTIAYSFLRHFYRRQGSTRRRELANEKQIEERLSNQQIRPKISPPQHQQLDLQSTRQKGFSGFVEPGLLTQQTCRTGQQSSRLSTVNATTPIASFIIIAIVISKGLLPSWETLKLTSDKMLLAANDFITSFLLAWTKTMSTHNKR